jgi:transcriptional regulator with XRE-family HTH domain
LHLGIGEELTRIRLDANVSIAALSRATGVDDAYIGRIEAGVASPSIEVLIALGVALGADFNLVTFLGPARGSTTGSRRPWSRPCSAASVPRWRPELEVPIYRPSRGVIDVVLHDTMSPDAIATEVHSELRRLEQQVRWGREKAEGLLARLGAEAGGSDVRRVSQLLVLRSTSRTRELARHYDATLRTAFPARAADAHAALVGTAGRWPGAAIIWAQVHGSKVWLMRHPPPGIEVGR